MSEDVFTTLQAPADALYKVKGSKHYGYVFPSENVDEAKAHLEALRKKHHDARHHAYAYRLGPSGDDWRASDDGEPSNSAGLPILGALKSKEVTNCLGVVVRYFGGTKLGVPGLIAAYRSAAEMALEDAGQQEVHPMISGRLTVPYDMIGAAELHLRQCEAQIAEQTFGDDCCFRFTLKWAEKGNLEGRLQASHTAKLTWLTA